MTEHSRGRLLILADNAVTNDSRLQKQARAAAASGWDVTVLGRASGARQSEWHLDGAKVRLVPVADTLSRRRVEFRRDWRHPLAYLPGHTRAYQVSRDQARHADLEVRRAELDVAARTASGMETGRLAVLRAASFVAAFVGRVRSAWVGVRERQTDAVTADSATSTIVGRAAIQLWTMLRGKRSWRRVVPGWWDAELGFAEIVDGYSPDIIHASGFQMLSVGARAKIRARAAGREVALLWDACEPLEGSDSWIAPVRKAYESEYLAHVDALVASSDELASQLQARHQPSEPPTVVLDAPELNPMAAGRDVRQRCGIDGAAQLIVYSGESSELCGLDLLVRALPDLPGVHAVFAADSGSSDVESLRRIALELDVVDRVHLLPAVSLHEHVSFLAGADVGVLPWNRIPSHEVQVPEEFFAYAHARVPMVVSDVRAMARVVRRTGCGEVFWDGNLNDFARALRLVLADVNSYRERLDRCDARNEWTWQSQSELLESVYVGLLRRVSGQFAIPAPASPAVSPASDSDTMAPHGK